MTVTNRTRHAPTPRSAHARPRKPAHGPAPVNTRRTVSAASRDGFDAGGTQRSAKGTEVANRLDPLHHYLPGNGETHCNAFANDYARTGWGYTGLAGKNANAQLQTMRNPASGFREVSAQDAIKASVDGKLTMVAWANPSGHGHIAAVVGSIGGRPAIAQAGKNNYDFVPVTRGFGNRAVHYFVHD